MAYTKQSWIDGETIANATRLNHIEDGIEAAHTAASGGGGGAGGLTPTGGDDGPQIASAVAALPAEGGTVRFTAGTFAIDTTITLDRPVHFVGVEGTVLAVNTEVFHVESGGLTLDGIEFHNGSGDGNVFTQVAGNGLNYSGLRAVNCKFDGVTLDVSARNRVQHPEGATAEGTAWSHDIQVVGCEFTGYLGNYSLEFAGCGDAIVDRCYFHDLGTDANQGDGIKVLHGAHDVRITNNTFERCSRDAMDIFSGYGSVIANNIMRDCGALGIDQKWNNGAVVESGMTLGRDIIVNNRAYGCTNVGISANGNDVLCMGNYCEGNGDHGFQVGFSNDDVDWVQTTRVRMIGNRSFNNQGDGFSFWGGAGCVVIGNTSTQNLYDGIYLADAASGFTVMGNQCTGNGEDGIDIAAATASTHFVGGNVTDGDYNQNFTLANDTALTVFDGAGTAHDWLRMTSGGTLVIGDVAYDAAFNAGRIEFYADAEFYGNYSHDGPTVGFYGTTPVARAADPGTATGTDATVINNIVTALRNLGLVQ